MPSSLINLHSSDVHDPLIVSRKGLSSLFNFDPGCKCFYMGHNGLPLTECSIGMKIRRGMTTEVEARMATYVWLTMSTMGHERQTSWQTTQRQYTQWLKSLWIRAMHKLWSRDPAHDFDVKLSSCRCSHSSCSDCQQTVTNSATFHDMHHHHVLHAHNMKHLPNYLPADFYRQESCTVEPLK